MRFISRAARVTGLLALFAVGSHFAIEYGSGGLWRGLRSAHAVVNGPAEVPYDLTQLRAVNETLDHIRKKYVEPERVDPRQMFLGALDQVQKEVAQVIVTHEEKSPTVKVRVLDQEEEFRVDNVQGHWDVAARLREVFAFLQERLRGQKVELAQVEYAAANGILRTLDPHSVFLSPEAYRDMNVSTSGHFGGLGIVISIRDQMLTVMRPMPGTPAGRAGLKRLDRIVKINNESTLNMPLEDAVERLRGEPGSKVTVWVRREGKEGWSGERPFELSREVIRVNSVESKKLDGGVGYVRLKQFQATTAKELSDALTSLRTQGGLKGLVLDLRGNPGGLLDQAGKVADLFLEQGTIYATVGHSEGRNEAHASRPGTEANYPIVVLVDGYSASASEIVSGALKNNDRAVVLGQTTFGKGSVQLVFPDVTPEGAALKLTIARYLTPGDISIQGTGVTPDIELDPMTVDNLEMNLFQDEGDLRERDLAKTLTGGGQRQQDPPTYQLRFNLPESVRAEIRDRGATIDDDFKLDTPIRIARDLVAAMPSAPRRQALDQLGPLVKQLGERELAQVAGELKALGVDWSAPPANYEQGPELKDVQVTLKTDRPDDTVMAGQPMTLTVEVTNKGKQPFYRLRGITKSDAGYYEQRELIFGKVAPGETRRATVPLGWCVVEGRKAGSSAPASADAKRVCRLPEDTVMRQDSVRVVFAADGADAPEALEFRPTVKSLPRPIFAYSYQVVDNRNANENGQIEAGEGATIFFRVKNIGEGPALEPQANMRNLTGDGLLLKAGRFDLPPLAPGEEREVELTFDVLETLTEPEIFLDLSVSDRALRVFSNEKLTLPVVPKGKVLVWNRSSGALQASSDIALYDQPSDKGLVLGTLPTKAVVARLAEQGDYVQVRLAPGRFAFAKKKDLASTTLTAPERVTYRPLLTRSPPLLKVRAAELSTRGDTIRIEAVAKDETRGVQDAFVFVGSRKVFYQLAGTNKGELTFSVDAPLKPGVNVITVVARENEDTSTRQTMVVRKDGPNGEALPTPKLDTFGEGWEFGEEP
ncbi:MAG TPA: MXAN_5808 family serine peptidase [Polyangiaceae bacterium]|nr:MXAN_5808 family serine peptidase [Polyangiaceae bacterium]